MCYSCPSFFFLCMVETNLFKIAEKENLLELELKNKKLADTFARMDFFSRLLHSLAPDRNNVWRESKRLDVEISGWPKNIKWYRTGEKTFTGKITDKDDFVLKQYIQILENALLGVSEGESGLTRKLYKFLIGNKNKWLEYRFHSKSRTIAALCVLYDLKAHSRNDLEINIPRNLAISIWPTEKRNDMQRTYGDPSKTADELRNEGWARIGEFAAMKVFREKIGGQIQQMYQLLKNEQTLQSQVLRSNIQNKWRLELYKSQNFTCQICLIKYDSEFLEPDHRIPVIYEADHLTENNFKDKLMTLCRYCNQQKRETTKRLPADYDWKNSPWAFPEKFDLEIIKRRISVYEKRTGKTLKEILNELSG